MRRYESPLLNGLLILNRQWQLNYIHRFVGRAIVIIVNFHGLSNCESLLCDPTVVLIVG
jgi:hypothetical protein